MATRPDSRRVARLTIPPALREGELAHHSVNVLDLSLHGARIRHQSLVHEGVVCYVDLSPALEALRLTGCIVWTHLCSTEQTLEGLQQSHYESGIEFTSLTPEQQGALATALEKLQTAQTEPDRKPSA
jgi:hypothetical protein